MRALIALTIANLRSYTRDRAALFWTIGFPLIFIVLFGFIFQNSRFDVPLGLADSRSVGGITAAAPGVHRLGRRDADGG